MKGAQYISPNNNNNNNQQKSIIRTSNTQHVAETLASYCDVLLRGELKGDSLLVTTTKENNYQQQQNSSSSETDENYLIDVIFELVTQLVSFFKDKDLVIELHRSKTAKRLLDMVQKNSTSSSAASASSSSTATEQNLDLECILAHKLSRVVDMSQTRKFEGMFADIERLADEQQNFQNFLLASSQGNSSTTTTRAFFKCSVLTSSKWPAFRTINEQNCPVNLQGFPSLHENIFAFEQFYKKQHQSRRLTWLLDPCTAVVSVNFPKGVKEISMTWTQAFVLCCVDEISSKRAALMTIKNKKGTTFEEVLKYCTVGFNIDDEFISKDNNDNEEDQKQENYYSLPFMSDEVRNSLASLALNPKFQILRKVVVDEE